jgi:hypothetical protein
MINGALIPEVDRTEHSSEPSYITSYSANKNYFNSPELLEVNIVATIEDSIKSIDKLINNNEKFL